MAKKKQKPLLQEGTVRRMMKLANMEAIGNGFITEKYTTLQEENPFGGDKDDRKRGGKYTHERDDTQEEEDKADYEKPTSKKGKERREKADLDENITEEEELELGAEEEVDVEGEEEIPGEEEMEAGDELEGEITITDDEAQDIIDLADKLKGAVGGEEEAPEEMPGEEELEMGAEEEVGLEEPGNRMYEEGLFEAALRGLDIDLVDDQAQKQAALMKEVKGRIYKRVINRLLRENQAPKKRSPKQ